MKNRRKHISGEDISVHLGGSRASVWKYIMELRKDGYRIDAVPNLGYMLVLSPDVLFGYEIKNGLRTERIGKVDIHHYKSITSTNDEAYRLAEAGEPEGVVVIAETQIGGKGRLGRKWVSPKRSGIYMSLILRPDVETDAVPTITLIAALSVAKALNNIDGIDARIKWPNDIMIGSKKVCGILTEMKAQPDRVDFIVLGMGINVNTSRGRLPDSATSIKNVTGKECDRGAIVRRVLEEFEKDYKEFQKGRFAALRKECKKLSLILGKKVEITEHHRKIKGKAVDIDEKGALVVLERDGTLRRVFSGDVVLCR